MPKVEVGDLVCMYRRKNKGMGLVLDKIDNIEAVVGIDMSPSEVLEEVSTLKTYQDRAKYRSQVMQESKDPEAVKVFLSFNAQGWCRKAKYKFAKVRWFKKPSAYESNVREDETWCPQEWLKKVSL